MCQDQQQVAQAVVVERAREVQIVRPGFRVAQLFDLFSDGSLQGFGLGAAFVGGFSGGDLAGHLAYLQALVGEEAFGWLPRS